MFQQGWFQSNNFYFPLPSVASQQLLHQFFHNGDTKLDTHDYIEHNILISGSVALGLCAFKAAVMWLDQLMQNIHKNRFNILWICEMYGFSLFQIHDSPWYIWLKLASSIIDSFITKILLDSTPDSLCRENYPQGSIQDVAGEAFIDSILRFSVT